MSSNFHDVSETCDLDTTLPRSPLGIIVWGGQGDPKRNEGKAPPQTVKPGQNPAAETISSPAQAANSQPIMTRCNSRYRERPSPDWEVAVG